MNFVPLHDCVVVGVEFSHAPKKCNFVFKARNVATGQKIQRVVDGRVRVTFARHI